MTEKQNAPYKIDWAAVRRALKTEMAVRGTTISDVARQLGRTPNSFTAWLNQGGDFTGLSAEGFVNLIKWIGTTWDHFIIRNAGAVIDGRKASRQALALAEAVADDMLPGEDPLAAAARLLRKQREDVK